MSKPVHTRTGCYCRRVIPLLVFLWVVALLSFGRYFATKKRPNGSPLVAANKTAIENAIESIQSRLGGIPGLLSARNDEADYYTSVDDAVAAATALPGSIVPPKSIVEAPKEKSKAEADAEKLRALVAETVKAAEIRAADERAAQNAKKAQDAADAAAVEAAKKAADEQAVKDKAAADAAKKAADEQAAKDKAAAEAAKKAAEEKAAKDKAATDAAAKAAQEKAAADKTAVAAAALKAAAEAAQAADDAKVAEKTAADAKAAKQTSALQSKVKAANAVVLAEDTGVHPPYSLTNLPWPTVLPGDFITNALTSGLTLSDAELHPKPFKSGERAFVSMAVGNEAAKLAVVMVQSLRDVATADGIDIVLLLVRGATASPECHNTEWKKAQGREHIDCHGPDTIAEEIISPEYCDTLRRLGATLRVVNPITRTQYTAGIPGGGASFWGMSLNR